MKHPSANDSPAVQFPADDFWWNDSGLAALLGIAPLLAASSSFASGLALGSGALLVLCASTVLATALARWIGPRWRTTAILLLIGALVTAVDLVFQARLFELHGQVGMYVPLIAANCFIVAQAETCAAGPATWRAPLDGLAQGVACVILLAGLGACRELLAPGLQVAALPAGALFLLAAVVALRQGWLARQGKR